MFPVQVGLFFTPYLFGLPIYFRFTLVFLFSNYKGSLHKFRLSHTYIRNFRSCIYARRNWALPNYCNGNCCIFASAKSSCRCRSVCLAKLGSSSNYCNYFLWRVRPHQICLKSHEPMNTIDNLKIKFTRANPLNFIRLKYFFKKNSFHKWLL